MKEYTSNQKVMDKSLKHKTNLYKIRRTEIGYTPYSLSCNNALTPRISSQKQISNNYTNFWVLNISSVNELKRKLKINESQKLNKNDNMTQNNY